jgi:hypothetical protein
MMKRMVFLLLCLAVFAACSGTVPTGSPVTSPPAFHATATASTIDKCITDLGSVGSGEYEVVITFSGIQMFDRQKANVVNVRMPNVVSGRAAIPDAHSTVPLRSAIPPHISYILGENSRLQNIDPDLLQPAYYEGSCYSYYRMNGDHVTVDDASVPTAINNSPLCTSDAKTDGEYCPNDGTHGGTKTKGSMYWLPSMTVINGAHAAKADHLLDVPDPAVMAGVVTVDRGYLETVVTNPSVWAFRASKSDTNEYTPQAIAQEVRWHMRGKGSSFVLHVERRSKKFDLSFTPVNGKVLLFIANSPAQESGPIRTAMGTSPDDHFPLYYEFLDNFSVADGRIPFTSAALACDASVIGETPSLQVCLYCKDDPYCKSVQTGASGKAMMVGMPLPSGLNCGGSQMP